MADLNAAATLQQASDFANNYAAATLEILNGATVLATFTIPSWSASNSGNNGLATAAAISDTTITGAGSQTADGARLVSSDTNKVWTLSVGTSGAEVNISSLTFVNGESASVNSAVITFPE